SAIGTAADVTNHQYDSHDFFDALAAGNLPNVVFLKAPGYQDGHAGYSSPLDEQIFITDTIIHSQQSTNPMTGNQADALTGPDMCGSSSTGLQAQGRCGYGPRLPFLVVSPWARTNFVDHTTTDQSSAIAFIEQNWGLPFVSPASGANPGSYDQYAGSIINMFDFTRNKGEIGKHKLFVDPTTGEVLKRPPKNNGGDEP